MHYSTDLKQHPEADAIVHTGDFAQAPTPVTYNAISILCRA
jgi:hypothetical protein